MIVGIAVFDRNIVAVDESRLLEALAKRSGEMGRILGRGYAQKADRRSCTVKRGHAERPTRRRPAQQANDLTPLHAAPTEYGRFLLLRTVPLESGL